MAADPPVLDPEVWGPHYWFFLHTIARHYPLHPNEVTKRKYYDMIQNLPLFLPDSEMGNQFAAMLDRYPVTSYLCSRSSFMRWMHFIHNKVNHALGKEEIQYLDSLERYYERPKSVALHEKWRLQRHYIILAFIFLCLIVIYVCY